MQPLAEFAKALHKASLLRVADVASVWRVNGLIRAIHARQKLSALKTVLTVADGDGAANLNRSIVVADYLVFLR